MLKRRGNRANLKLNARDGEDVGIGIQAVDLGGGGEEAPGLPCACGGLKGAAYRKSERDAHPGASGPIPCASGYQPACHSY